MLEVAAKKNQTLDPGSQTPTFIQGDAQQIPFPDSSFDIVTMGYGLRNLTSWEREARSKCTASPNPALRLIVESDFGKPANALWRASILPT